MATFSLDGDNSGLPRTRRSQIPFEMSALEPREMWGAGNGAVSVPCKQTWDTSVDWIKDMVGEVTVVKPGSQLLLNRHIPEPLGYGDGRVMFCSMVDQIDQGGNASRTPFQQIISHWPATDWVRYRATWEAMPFAVLHATENIDGLPSMAEIEAGASSRSGAIELYRYVVRSRKVYSREQPVPAGGPTGGFRVLVDPDTTPTTRHKVGQVVFRPVGYADIQMRWVRVPVGWPPPVGYTPADSSNPWPPKFNPAALNPTANRRTRDSYINCINDDWFDVAAPDGICAPPGTLLYVGYDDSNKYYDAAGDWVCDVIFSFKQKQSLDAAGNYGGWNFYLTAQGLWKEVSTTGANAGQRPYKSVNFNKLFEYAAA